MRTSNQIHSFPVISYSAVSANTSLKRYLVADGRHVALRKDGCLVQSAPYCIYSAEWLLGTFLYTLTHSSE